MHLHRFKSDRWAQMYDEGLEMRRKILSTIAILCFAVFCSCREKSFITFNLACEKDSSGCLEIAVQDTKEKLHLKAKPSLTIDDIVSAAYEVRKSSDKEIGLFKGLGAVLNTSESLKIKFTEEGKKKLFKITSANTNKRLGVVVDGKLLIAPKMREPIESGELQIAGNLTAGEVKSIVQRINQLKSLE